MAGGKEATRSSSQMLGWLSSRDHLQSHRIESLSDNWFALDEYFGTLRQTRNQSCCSLTFSALGNRSATRAGNHVSWELLAEQCCVQVRVD